MHEIYDCVKAGKPADMDMWKKIDDQLKELGCQVALLACTELSVIKADNNLPDFYLDPMEVMADKADVYKRQRLRSLYQPCSYIL